MLTFNFSPFPVLNTERLCIKLLEPVHADELFLLRSDPRVMHFIPRPMAVTVNDALELIKKKKDGIDKNESINWGIFLKENDKLVGAIGYPRMNPENHRAEVGYLLAVSQQGKGIMQEALQAVVKYGFEKINLNTIEAVIDPENTSSVRVVERCGFVKEAHFKKKELVKGEFRDITVYTIFRPDTGG